MKPSLVLGCLLVVLMAFSVYQMEYHVQGLRQEMEEVNRQLTVDMETIHVLRAEWSYLNQHERLQKIAERKLELRQINTSQFQDIENIPLRKTVLASNAERNDMPDYNDLDLALSRMDFGI